MKQALTERAQDLSSAVNAAMRSRQLRGACVYAGNGLEDPSHCFTGTSQCRPNTDHETRTCDLAMIVEEVKRQSWAIDIAASREPGTTFASIVAHVNENTKPDGTPTEEI